MSGRPVRALLTSLMDGFFALRPVVLIPVWVFAVLGFSRARTLAGGAAVVWGEDQRAVLIRIAVFSLAVGSVYVVNQLADRDVDRINGGFPLFVRGGLGTAAGVIVAGLSMALSLGIGWYLDRRLPLFSLFAFVLGVVYSCRPTLFSGRPVLDFLSNAVGFGVIAFGVGWHLAGTPAPLSSRFLLSCIPYTALMGAGSISSTLPDIEGDRRGGKRTTAVALGATGAHLVATALIGLAAATALWQRDWTGLVCAGLPIPLYMLYLLRPGPASMEAVYKAGGAVVAAVAVFLFPLLLPPAMGVFAATWLYFRIRHKVSYPSLVPVFHDR